MTTKMLPEKDRPTSNWIKSEANEAKQNALRQLQRVKEIESEVISSGKYQSTFIRDEFGKVSISLKKV